MILDHKEFKLWEIWAEGYIATGERGTAVKLGEYWANSFDEAVEMWNEQNFTSKTKCERYTPSCFVHGEKGFANRRSNWKYWGCALFDTEAEARLSFG